MELKQWTVTVERTGTEVEVWQKGEGPNLVFLHGAGGLAGWEPALELLSKSYCVTAPIHPGFGGSGSSDFVEGVLDSVLHTFDVLDELGIERPILMGHSMGGMIAAEMAATCPNDISSLILVSPIGLWDDEHPVLDFFTKRPHELVPYVFSNLKHPMAQMMAIEPGEDDIDIDMVVAYLKGLSTAGRLMWPIPDRGLGKRISRIKAPTLIVWGKDDGLVPVFYAEEFQKQIVGARLTVISGASHMVLIEKPTHVVKEIGAFLGGAKAKKPKTRKTVAAKPKKTVAKKAAKKPAKKLKKKAVKKAKKAVKKKVAKKKATKKKAVKKKATKKKAAKKKSRKRKSAKKKVARKRGAKKKRRR